MHCCWFASTLQAALSLADAAAADAEALGPNPLMPPDVGEALQLLARLLQDGDGEPLGSVLQPPAAAAAAVTESPQPLGPGAIVWSMTHLALLGCGVGPVGGYCTAALLRRMLWPSSTC